MRSPLAPVALASLLVMAALPYRAPGVEDLPWITPPPAARLLDLLPESTVLAVEVRDLATRWPELRRVPAIGRALGRFLQGGSLVPDDLPLLASDRAVLALVLDRDQSDLVPLALLRPRRIQEAGAYLDRAARHLSDDGPRFAVRRRSGALWIVPPRAAGRLGRLVGAGQGSLTGLLPMAAAAEALPAGGLVRGWLNPPALRELLRSQPPATWPAAVELLVSFVAAELQAVRHVAFRRDLEVGGVVTEAIVGYDAAELPREVRRALRTPAAPVRMPVSLPPGVVAMSSTRPEPVAGLAWLRYVSRSDPRGPWRNLEFWLDEAGAHTGLALERELAATLGERAWTFVLAGASPDTVRLALVVETRDAPRLERVLLGLRSWLLEQAWARTLGVALPRTREERVAGGTAYGLSLWTPVGELPGPAFVVGRDHLVVGSDESALRAGLELLATREAWRSPVPLGPDRPAAQGSFAVRVSALAPLIQTLLRVAAPELPDRAVCALGDLAGGLDSARLGIWYEEDALRLRSRVRLGDQLAAEGAP